MTHEIQRSLVLLKPDCVKRMYSGEIISRFEKAGYKIVAMKMVWNNKDFFNKHYFDVEERHGKKIHEANLKGMMHGPVIAMILEGVNAIEGIRKMVGPTEPRKAAPGTIRGDYAHYTYALADKNDVGVRNLIHASSSLEDAKYETELWFNEEEIHSYKCVHDAYVLE